MLAPREPVKRKCDIAVSLQDSLTPICIVSIAALPNAVLGSIKSTEGDNA